MKDVRKLEGNDERSKKGKPKVDLECGPAQPILFEILSSWIVYLKFDVSDRPEAKKSTCPKTHRKFVCILIISKISLPVSFLPQFMPKTLSKFEVVSLAYMEIAKSFMNQVHSERDKK